MDNPMQAPPLIHHNHVFDPALTHHQQPQSLVDDQQQQASSSTEGPNAAPGLHPDGSPLKRRPGRPKGSTKKNLLAGSSLPPKVKRPVGRPRKDGFPAGSVGPRVKRERTATQAPVPLVHYGGVGYPPVPYGYSISVPIPPGPVAAPPPTYQMDATVGAASGDNDWADLARTNPNAFLGTLLAALAAPNPVSSAGPTVEEAFKSHLVSLAPNPAQMQPIPSLYSILKTFWLPSSPAYFSLTASASTARTPSEHRFLYWDPQPLVFNGIACPNCSAPLVNRGRISSGPVKIYDIEKPFFIVGCEYVCRSPACVAATSPEGRKFASTDSSILRSLPMLLKDEFPARLLHGDADAGSGPNVWNWKAMGVSTGLWNLVVGGLRAGLKKDVILRLIWAVQHKTPDGVGDPAVLGPPHGGGSGDAGNGGHVMDGQDEKMDEDEDEDGEGEGDEVNGQPEASSSGSVVNHNQSQSQSQGESQTLSSTNFQDAYGDAWKENTAMTEAQPKPPSGPVPTSTTASASATPAPQQPQAAVQQPQQTAVQMASPQPQSHPQQPMIAPQHTYTPYPAYPFAPYAYMPHHIVNGQMVALPPTASASGSGSGLTLAGAINGAAAVPDTESSPSVVTATSASAVDGSSSNAGTTGTTTTTIMTGPHGKRSPRHCCKCGSQECKGKGGRSFCMSACQDCGKLECKGRNSRRPDKKCSEGWS